MNVKYLKINIICNFQKVTRITINELNYTFINFGFQEFVAY